MKPRFSFTAERKLTWFAALLALALVGASKTTRGTYKTLDPPESLNTYAYGVSGNIVVGTYNDYGWYPCWGSDHGFLYDASTGTYTPFDVPGAEATAVYYISGNNVVGECLDSALAIHFFLYDGSTWTTFDPPPDGYLTGWYVWNAVTGVSGDKVIGQYWIDGKGYQTFLYDAQTKTYKTIDIQWPSGISGNNLVGCSGDAGGAHGVLYDASTDTYTTLYCPKAETRYPTQGSYTYAMGVSGDNVVGCYLDNSKRTQHGFVYNCKSKSWKTFDPQGSTGTEPLAVSGNNVVGRYWDQFGDKHGFLYTGSNSTTLDPPGALDTEAFGVSGNNVVGYYQDGTGMHGFLYVAP